LPNCNRWTFTAVKLPTEKVREMALQADQCGGAANMVCRKALRATPSFGNPRSFGVSLAVQVIHGLIASFHDGVGKTSR